MSQAREILSGLTKQHASGKEGYQAAIEAFAEQYKQDADILPSEWAELNVKQTVCHYGGWLVAHKGFTSTEVHSFLNAIGHEYAKIDLTATKPAIIAQLKALDEAWSAANDDEANKLLEMGDTTDKHAKSLVRIGREYLVAYEATPTVKSEILIRGLIKELMEALPDTAESVVHQAA